MENKYFINTLIKRDHKFGGNEYIIGRIDGIGYILSEEHKAKALMVTEEGTIYSNVFTAQNYDKFINIIDKLYPGLITANYKIESN